MRIVRTAVVALASGTAALLAASGPQARVPPPAQAVADSAAFSWDELRAKRAASGGPWLEFLRTQGLFAGAYVLAAGAADGQQPHATDEVYYVVRGKGRFATGSGAAARDFAAAPGALLFVAGGVPHRFHSIEEELELLVFFTTLQPPATRAEVDDVLRRYERAYNANDAAALAAVYTEDGLFTAPDGTTVRGRTALAEHWATQMGSGLVLQLESFETDSRAGFAAGTWQLDGDPAQRDAPKHRGRFVVGLRRGPDGTWRMSFDTYHDAPAK